MRALTPLTEEQRAIQTVAREFAAEHIAPFSEQWDRDQYFEPELVPKLGELGFLGMMIPEKYDGLGLDTLTYLVALEEIAIVDASVAVMLSVHNSLPTQMLLRWGTEEQKERFLKPMARGEMLGAFALSEPEAGSDAASLRTQAVRDGDHWVLNGTKAWVSSGTKLRRSTTVHSTPYDDASSSAAATARGTIAASATIVASPPSRTTFALPSSSTISPSGTSLRIG